MHEYYYFNNLDYSIHITDDTKSLTPYTFLDNNMLWENDSILYFFKNIDKNKKCNIVDIGAQSGLYTLFAKYLPNSTFYSFEPFPKTYELLKKNIALNNITNVKTYNIGISNKKGSTVLNTCRSHNGLHTIGSNPIRFNDINPINIEIDTLDNIFYYHDICVDYIKIDTEGHEYFILQGGEKTIKKYRPMIQLEYNEINMQQCNVLPNELNNLIHDLGYKKIEMISEELYIAHESI